MDILQSIVGPVEGFEGVAQAGDGTEFFKNQRMLQSATNVRFYQSKALTGMCLSLKPTVSNRPGRGCAECTRHQRTP